MSRYALELAYRGTRYAGWQRQPNAPSVEETVDTALSTILGQELKIVGCGRTDTGVHASYYVAHFDFDGTIPPAFLARYNRFVAEDVALLGLWRVADDFHARFHASSRSYTYRIRLAKDPFQTETATLLPRSGRYDQEKMQAAAQILLGYGAFAPFCKAHSDAFTMDCTLTESRWVFGPEEWTFHISANRFLRGMVRLIVGTCLQIGEGKMSLEALREVLDRQLALPQPHSAPPTGLYLSAVEYPNKAGWEWQN